ncbi:MAG: stage II sporulation protein P [Clostridia bacterium]|nr:stage II sporulation protein P [Clostridia bacterium]
MSELPVKKEGQNEEETVNLEGTFRGKYRVLAVFLIACAIFVAAFALTAIFHSASGDGWLGKHLGGGTETTATPNTQVPSSSGTVASSENPPVEEIVIPEGATPILSKDLSYPELGVGYLHNETPYTPNVVDLMNQSHRLEAVGEEILVLIVHTHTSESYLMEEKAYFAGEAGDETYSRDHARSVLVAGEALAQALNRRGIPTLHCTVSQDEGGLTGAYRESAKTVEEYLRAYPSIRLVIDLHRDSVMTSDGAYVRTAASDTREPCAQVMAVVGSDCNGTQHPNWERNLSLALQLRSRLNVDGASVSRPVSLRKASFNQELSPYSLLLEIGTGANTVEEARRCALLVGDALADILLGAE